MDQQKFIQALNMVVKAKAFVYGQRLVEQIAKKQVFLVVSCTDLGINSQKKLADKTTFYQVPLLTSQLTMEQLTAILQHQSPIGAIGITDANLAKLVWQTTNN